MEYELFLPKLPPLTPPYTGGGEVSLRLREITKRFFPLLCKGEPEEVVLVSIFLNFLILTLNFKL